MARPASPVARATCLQGCQEDARRIRTCRTGPSKERENSPGTLTPAVPGGSKTGRSADRVGVDRAFCSNLGAGVTRIGARSRLMGYPQPVLKDLKSGEVWKSVGVIVAIAGGGIAGLTLAGALQPQGVDVVVLERQPEVRDSGAGISLWPNALAALDVAGLGDAVRPLGRTLASGGQKRLDGRVALNISRRSFEAAFGEGLMCVDRGELVRALAGRLRPGTVRTGCAVTGYDSRSSGVTVRISDGEGLTVDALVGADGINSAIASELNGPLRSSYSGYTAWRGIAETSTTFDSDQIWACLAGGHEFGWMPVGDAHAYWFATSWLPQGQRFSDGDDAYLKQTFSEWPQPIPDLLAATPPERLVRNDVVDRAMPDRWSDGAVTLVGDAAHAMRPHLGQGGCQAIEDAVVLASCLAKSAEPAIAFADYERRRRRRARLIVFLSRFSGFTRPPGPVTTAFDRVTSTLPGLAIGPALRSVAPIAGYKAGQRAVRSG
jgi:2-polyprenyl-6-methoxyphenol hydroxylase-like FAD-dependent oxidoreductase